MKKSLVVITGASGGIGLELAKNFHNAGHPLGLFSRNLNEMKKLNLPNVIYQSVDITDFNSVKKALALSEETYGPIDCFINNAGFLEMGEFISIDQAHHEKMIKTNFLGVLNGALAVLPGMQKRRRGTIINISSMADRNIRPLYATYAASKAAVKSLSESLRMANAQFGIRVCNVAPGPTKTKMMVAANLTQKENMDPQELAKIILSIYELPQSICIRDIVVAPTKYEP